MTEAVGRGVSWGGQVVFPQRKYSMGNTPSIHPCSLNLDSSGRVDHLLHVPGNIPSFTQPEAASVKRKSSAGLDEGVREATRSLRTRK